MAGYSGYSKSNNAIDAEADGRFPITAATKLVAEATGLNKADARKLLEKLHNGEYHHTSKFYNRTKFYDVAEAIRHHALRCMVATLPADWREPMSAARKHVDNDPRSLAERSREIAAIDAAHAATLGVDVDDLIDALYEVR